MKTRVNRGLDAENIAVAYERLRLGPEQFSDVKYVGNRHSMGFDIQSRNSSTDVSPRFIEVKSSAEGGYIFLTERERSNLAAFGDSGWIYLVDVALRRISRTIQNPIRLLEADSKALVYKIKI